MDRDGCGCRADVVHASVQWEKVPNTNPALKADLSHEGRFTASAPLCPTGTAVDTKDVELEPLSVMRTHTAKKLRKPARTYSVRAVLDAHEGPVTYSVDFRAGRSLVALKNGTAASGRATASVRFGAPRGVRTMTVIVTVTDVVGNESATTLSVRLR